MPLSIATNLASMTAQRSFLNSNADLETAFERLSTGKRVNSSVDDAAGLAIGKDLESRVRGLNQAIRNVNDGISMVQIAEGTLDEVTTILQRMRDLAVQGANDSLGTTERGYLDTEHSKLADALGKAIDLAKFNDTDLIADSGSTNVTIQSGADAADTTALVINALSEASLDVSDTHIDMTGATKAEFTLSGVTAATGTMRYQLTVNGVTYAHASGQGYDAASLNALATNSSGLGKMVDASGNRLDATYDITETGGVITVKAQATGDYGTISALTNVSGETTTGFVAGTAEVVKAGGTGISVIDVALATVASERAKLGATQSQLESTVRNLANVAENTSAAAGRIMDTDYAAETANLTKAQILQQAATSILAQANAQPQAVLSLLQ
jgi:flagellin